MGTTQYLTQNFSLFLTYFYLANLHKFVIYLIKINMPRFADIYLFSCLGKIPRPRYVWSRDQT